jgi:hypothetical protein
MEIKKFEAYKYGYRGKGLQSNRKQVLEELFDMFTDQDFLGFEIAGVSYNINDEKVWLVLSAKDKVSKTIQLDFSDMGIEIGEMPWNYDLEEYDEFIPEISLDTDEIKQMKKYKKDIKNYNL